MTIFYPAHLPLPTELHHPQFYLRPLLASDVELDYDAVIASHEALQVYSLGQWPRKGFTLEENLADLQRHEREHRDRERFTFTVLTPDATRCLGCVYIKPLNSWLEKAVHPTRAHPLAARVTFWLRPECVAADLDRELLATLRTWFREAWALDQITFLANENETRRTQILQDAGLTVQYPLTFAGLATVFYFYG